MQVILNGEEQEVRDDITVAELLHDLQIILQYGAVAVNRRWCGKGIMRRPTSEPGIASRSYARLEAVTWMAREKIDE
jgi:hypothetical protein